jgi:hypothetical protein
MLVQRVGCVIAAMANEVIAPLSAIQVPVRRRGPVS